MIYIYVFLYSRMFESTFVFTVSSFYSVSFSLFLHTNFNPSLLSRSFNKITLALCPYQHVAISTFGQHVSINTSPSLRSLKHVTINESSSSLPPSTRLLQHNLQHIRTRISSEVRLLQHASVSASVRMADGGWAHGWHSVRLLSGTCRGQPRFLWWV